MKIAIASEGKEKTDLVSPVSGRAPYYIIFEDGKFLKAVKNPFVVGGGGAGVSVAQMLGNENVDVVISGKFGDNMLTALKQKKIKAVVVNDKTVEEAVKEIK